MKLLAPTAAPLNLVEAARKILDQIKPGRPARVELDEGEDAKVIKLAFREVDPDVRVSLMRDSGGHILLVRRFTPEELEERANRPPAKRRAKTKPGK